MKTSDFYAVAPLTPVNKTAAQVTAKGDRFEFRDRRDQFVSFAPPKGFPVPRNQPQFVDMTGQRVGRFTVVSFAGSKRSDGNGTRWNVRCQCGRYEQRKGRTLRDPVYAARARCSECDRVAENRSFYGVRAHMLRDRFNARKSRCVD